MIHLRHIVRRIVKRLWLGTLPLLAATSLPAHAADGDTLAQARSRGTLRCGVSEGIAGFSAKDAAGHWSGLDVDFCRAVAAAALGRADKVTFVALKASARFPALRTDVVDLISRNTTWTLARESTLGVQFAGILFYDGQAFMVPQQGAPKSIAALDRATVCVEKGTSSAEHLAAYSAAKRLSMRPLAVDSAAEVADAFLAGRCLAYTADASHLAAVRLRGRGGSQAYVILPERISKEPLGPVVRNDDQQWLTLVRWVLFSLIAAEESGITQSNVPERMRDPLLAAALDPGDDASKALGVAPGWATRAVQSVGNYGEMFERNLGAQSPLKLERGPNRPWTQGGLMYAPPMR
ncbi:amino acid ABC transporter substrate-binding protein [Cupriavidus sp. UME77]|uniref:amino acid ABC transporter substrate-binding protein n=1 Tax=Cupriavidus sp. UME77 TaxID=1862321 RepID=UPI0016017255|nr:amino acid ABC transporter substrate-binding protein [Cupriavidus sp. UME77]MBB1631441.1 ABC transporter substrate-binding protein [Cupriavidus sp. UME77]